MEEPARVHNGACPYLPDREWVADVVHASQFGAEEYEKLLEQGVRRSGRYLYRNACPGCDECIPLRVSTERFSPRRTQRRVLRKNADISVKAGPVTEDPAVVSLYRRHHIEWHGHSQGGTYDEYRAFLASSPYPLTMMRYELGEKLVGVGWVDVLPDGISSVYFAFDPDYSSRRLGTFSIMKEIEWARGLGKSWLYLGFWVPGGKSMDYKAQFRPHEIAPEQRWRPPPRE
ncbi:MAG: arginyltransferase [Spirochaetales bacterium]